MTARRLHLVGGWSSIGRVALGEAVMRSIGLPPRPPYPDGYAVPAGDLSLLDPVCARGRLWREA